MGILYSYLIVHHSYNDSSPTSPVHVDMLMYFLDSVYMHDYNHSILYFIITTLSDEA